MDEFVYMGLNYDQWMHISAGVGILLLMFSYWLPNLGWFPVNMWAIYFGKILGFGFIGIPLFTRWFLSESLILTISVIMVAISSFYIYKRKKGI